MDNGGYKSYLYIHTKLGLTIIGIIGNLGVDKSLPYDMGVSLVDKKDTIYYR